MAGIALVLWAPSAHAEPSAADRALATQLFQEGREAMARGDLAVACPKLEESQRLDPGGGTLLNVATCHEAAGRTATAWTEFHEALGMAERDGQPERVTFAEEHIAALEPRLARLVIVVPPPADHESLTILRDGSPVARPAWGTAMPIDPGEHRIDATAVDRQGWSTTITVVDADRREIVVPVLEPLPPLPAPPPLAPPPPPHWAVPPAPPPETSREPRRLAGWVVAATGFGALAAGGIAGVVAIVKDDQSDALCEPRCDDEGYALNQDAKVAADASTGLFVAGAVVAAVGIVLVLTGGEPASTPMAWRF
jgi:hypothetical protein